MYEVSHTGKIRNVISKKLVVGSLNQDGYRKVGLIGNNSYRSWFYVHRLVAMHFVPNPNGYVEVHHKNGKRDDNRSSNVMWVTHAENMKYIYSPMVRNHRWSSRKYPKMI
jgi:hypothetical protein